MPNIVINNVAHAFGPLVQAKFPQLETNIEVPWVVRGIHINTIIRALMEGGAPLPKTTLGSHRDVYYTIKLAKVLDAYDAVINSFMSWTLSTGWADLMNPEYLTLIESVCPLLVDWKIFFTEYKLPYKQFIEKMIELPELRADPVLWVNSLIFIKNFDFNTCFEDLNDETRSKVFEMKKRMKKCVDLFLINPYQDFLKSYFKYTPTELPVWSRDRITAVRKYEVGENTLVTFDEFIQRFNSFTENHVSNLDKTACIYAGGALSKMLGVNYDPKHARQSDVDMFAGGNDYDTRKNYVKIILEHLSEVAKKLESPIYYAYRGSVVSVYITGVKRKYQVITNDCSGKYGIIERFDVSHIQWMYDGERVLGTPEALLSMREQATRLNNNARLKVNRLVKALYCGYDIIKEEYVINNVIDITDLLTKPSTGDSDLARIIRGFYGYYYPTKNEDEDPEITKYQHMTAIERDNSGFIVTDNIDNTLNNLIVGGNFDNTYDSHMYTTFNAATVTNSGVRRGNRVEKVNNNLGVIRLLTSMLTVKSSGHGEEGFTVICSIDEDFKKFLETVNTVVFNKIAPGARLTTKLGANDTISFTYPRRILNILMKDGKSILKTQHGRLLNIDEDLLPGDKIQVLFEIHASIMYDSNNMLLSPRQFIKHVTDVPDVIHEAPKIDELPTEVASNDVIVYDD